MKIRSFGLLLVGPLPMGAFAEPEQEEMYRAPRRDRMRLFAAGPSINLIATYIVIILLSDVGILLLILTFGLQICNSILELLLLCKILYLALDCFQLF